MPDTTPAPSAEDVAAAWLDWKAADEQRWRETFGAEPRPDIPKSHELMFKAGYRYARARQDEGRDAALHAAVSALYFADDSDYGTALWEVVSALDPQMADLLEKDEKAAYDLCERNAAMRRAEEGSDGREGV